MSIGLCIALFVFFFLLQVQRPVRPELTQQDIEQRAVTIAQTEHQGVVTKLDTQQLTFAQVGALNCSWFQRLRQVFDTQPWNGCDPHTPFWRVQIEGTFQWDQGVTSNLHLDLLTDGTVMAKWTES